MERSDEARRGPRLLFDRIEPLRDPTTLDLEPEEIIGRQKRHRRTCAELVATQLDIQLLEMLERASAAVPEFKYLGPNYDVLQCGFIHIQEHGCGASPPESDGCAFVRGIVDVVSAAEQLSLGKLREIVSQAELLHPQVQEFAKLMTTKLLAEREVPSFAGSRRACDDGDELFAGTSEYESLMSWYLRRWRKGASDAMDRDNRPSLSRAEGALAARGYDERRVREIIIDLRNGSGRPLNNIRGRFKPDRPILIIEPRT